MRPPHRIRSWLFFLVGAVFTVSPRHGAAQEDFRSLDPDRPLHVTDAYPKKYLEWEFQVGLEGAWTEAGRKAFGGLFELETGLFRNFEIGAGVEVATEDEAGVARTGVAVPPIQLPESAANPVHASAGRNPLKRTYETGPPTMIPSVPASTMNRAIGPSFKMAFKSMEIMRRSNANGSRYRVSQS